MAEYDITVDGKRFTGTGSINFKSGSDVRLVPHGGPDGIIVTVNGTEGVASVETGKGAPSADPVNVGDTYIDTEDGDVYQAVGLSAEDWKLTSGNVESMEFDAEALGLVVGESVQAYSDALSKTTAPFTKADKSKVDSVSTKADKATLTALKDIVAQDGKLLVEVSRQVEGLRSEVANAQHRLADIQSAPSNIGEGDAEQEVAREQFAAQAGRIVSNLVSYEEVTSPTTAQLVRSVHEQSVLLRRLAILVAPELAE